MRFCISSNFSTLTKLLFSYLFNDQVSKLFLVVTGDLDYSTVTDAMEPLSGSFPKEKVKVIGIYRHPRSGKTYLLNQLKQELGKAQFTFYEGSEVIDAHVPGGLRAFNQLQESEKISWHHYMFWNEDDEAGHVVCTENDLKTFTHIVYLDVPVAVISQRRGEDTERSRSAASVEHLRKWKQTDKEDLRHLSRQYYFLFIPVISVLSMQVKVSILLRDF